jgi:uncharacterized protein YxjI
MIFYDILASAPHLHIRQRRELAELFGFETKNTYEVLTSEAQSIGLLAEEGRGFLGIVLRQLLNHWRSFQIHLVAEDGTEILTANHPFRFYFSKLEVKDPGGRNLGVMEKNFSLLTKSFDIEIPGTRKMTVRSPFWKIWTFQVMRGDRLVASISKKWGGGLKEFFTDADFFHLTFEDSGLTVKERMVLLLSALYIDLLYFEGNNGGVLNFFSFGD